MASPQTAPTLSPRTVPRWPLWLVRIGFLIVFALNIQCALQFIIDPESFASSYELSGVPGNAAVRGIGIAFLMWNATYPAFIASPMRFSVLGPVIIVQQAIGAVGETLIFLSLGDAHPILSVSIARFMAFDWAGLVFLLFTFLVFALHARGRRSGADRVAD